MWNAECGVWNEGQSCHRRRGIGSYDSNVRIAVGRCEIFPVAV